MSEAERIAKLEAQMAEVLERVAQHGPEHDLEAVDPMEGRYQETDVSGAPTHEAPAGTRWHNRTDLTDYINKTGGTDWTLLETGGAGAPLDADYLVGSAQGDLTAEIVVGSTPGGQLGGSWGSPNVDRVHADGPHHDEGHPLASHTTKPHSDLTGVTASQHHPKYTDEDARAAVPYQVAVSFGWNPQAPQRFLPT